MHTFDEAIALQPTSDGLLRAHTSAAYWNSYSPFGGTTAATVLNAVLAQSQRVGDPISFTVNFLAPIKMGEFTIQSTLLRTGRSTQHWIAQAFQGETTVISALAFFGVRRPTWSETEVKPPVVLPPADSVIPALMNPNSWLTRYDIRYARGLIGPESADSVTHAWIADAPSRPVDFLSLTAYADTFYSRLHFRRPDAPPIATVSMTVYYHADAHVIADHGADPVLGVAYAQTFQNGYFDQQGQLWGKSERLLATTQQIVWYRK